MDQAEEPRFGSWVLEGSPHSAQHHRECPCPLGQQGPAVPGLWGLHLQGFGIYADRVRGMATKEITESYPANLSIAGEPMGQSL